jgi:hypothetical protein
MNLVVGLFKAITVDAIAAVSASVSGLVLLTLKRSARGEMEIWEAIKKRRD